MRGAAVTCLIIVLSGAVGRDGGNNSRATDVARLFAEMVGELRSPDVEVRKKAVADLNAAAGQMFCAIDSLNQALKDPDPEIRTRAARAIADTASLKQAVPALIVASRDSSREVRLEAVVALGNIGPVTPDVVPALTQALSDPILEVSTKAATALGHIGPAAKESVPTLIKYLQTEGDDPQNQQRVDFRCGVALSLGNIGYEARDAVPAMLDILKKGENRNLQQCIPIPLGKIGAHEKEVVPALVSCLKDEKQRYLRPGAAQGLGYLGSKAKSAVSDLVEALDVSGVNNPREAQRIQEAVLNGLECMGQHASSAVPAVEKLLADPTLEAPVRTTGKRTLGAIKPPNHP